MAPPASFDPDTLTRVSFEQLWAEHQRQQVSDFPSQFAGASIRAKPAGQRQAVKVSPVRKPTTADDRAFRLRTVQFEFARHPPTPACSVAWPCPGLDGPFPRLRRTGLPRHKRQPACRGWPARRRRDSLTARRASSTASILLRTVASGLVASTHATSFRAQTSPGHKRITARSSVSRLGDFSLPG